MRHKEGRCTGSWFLTQVPQYGPVLRCDVCGATEDATPLRLDQATEENALGDLLHDLTVEGQALL